MGQNVWSVLIIIWATVNYHKINTGNLLDASEETGPEENAEKY
jgi:hypothetical protein